MIQLSNREDMSIEKHGVRFTGVRVHGGNEVKDSLGCPLVAKNFDGDAEIWQSISKELTEEVEALIAAGHSVKWCITSLNTFTWFCTFIKEKPMHSSEKHK